MVHPIACCRARRAEATPLPVQRRKFNLISILSAPPGVGQPVEAGPQPVDAGWPTLYKTAGGGGCNPAAAVLWSFAAHVGTPPREWHISREQANRASPENKIRKHNSVDQANRRNANASSRSVAVEGF